MKNKTQKNSRKGLKRYIGGTRNIYTRTYADGKFYEGRAR